MKKTLLLCAALLTATLSNAQEALTFTSGVFNYTVTTADEAGAAETVSLTGVVEGETLPADLTIPASVNEGGVDYAITLIASGALRGEEITTVTIEGDTEPGHQSFMECANLTTVNLPLSSGSIGAQAFRSCTALTTVNIPNILLIGVQSFRNCTALKTIDLPSVTSIGNGPGAGLSFWQSSALETVNMPVIDSISTGAFNSCAALTSLIFPSSLTKLDQTNYNMFKGCTNIKSVIVQYTTFIPLEFNSVDPTSVNTSIFADVAGNASLTVPAGNGSLYSTSTVWSSFSSFAEAALSINSPEAALGWNVYTGVDSIIIENDNVQAADVTIYGANGSAILNTSVDGQSSNIDTSSLSSGVYVLKVNTEKGIFTKRFVR